MCWKRGWDRQTRNVYFQFWLVKFLEKADLADREVDGKIN
jgi:hypothetical protein